MRVIVVGTRGSALALTQTRWVVERLKEQWPEAEFKIKTIQTRGDRGAPPTDRDIFVKELEEALLRGEIDIAVHSLKDLPTEQPEGLVIASIPKRVDPRDVFIGRNGIRRLEDLPEGAVVGTSSVRRKAQLLAYRPDLVVRELRGNVDTRLSALGSGEFDGIILAAAGLLRLDLRNRIDAFIDPKIMLPAPGQGALALEVREGDDIADELAYSIHHHPTDDRTTAERSFLHHLGAGCLAPVGALAHVEEDGTLRLEGVVVAPDGSSMIHGEIEGDAEEAWELGAELARDILEQGGKRILEGLRLEQ
ncbi:hydroxymethylbilane synthase [Marinithermus hydrothermalis]|uniref:Porphobilinogen deaminase n=1 Tax=Marinithermus hydrothermalis (strain DSM 14884 / JCM 11576 / T1) TaxID=869210 RepID=F2NNM8_MARHT|nr:hydroxymethylbilane synthase [Marinithermus hydrothermalis]AEB11043.1 Porphobilinogen deaminase [Marinithermus hydrothermalis DSM 14884]